MSFLKLRIHRKKRSNNGVLATAIFSLNNAKVTYYV